MKPFRKSIKFRLRFELVWINLYRVENVNYFTNLTFKLKLFSLFHTFINATFDFTFFFSSFGLSLFPHAFVT